MLARPLEWRCILHTLAGDVALSTCYCYYDSTAPLCRAPARQALYIRALAGASSNGTDIVCALAVESTLEPREYMIGMPCCQDVSLFLSCVTHRHACRSDNRCTPALSCRTGPNSAGTAPSRPYHAHGQSRISLRHGADLRVSTWNGRRGVTHISHIVARFGRKECMRRSGFSDEPSCATCSPVHSATTAPAPGPT